MTDRLSDADLAAMTPEQIARAEAERDPSPRYADERLKMHRHFGWELPHPDATCDRPGRRIRVYVFDTAELEAHEAHIAARYTAEVEALRADNERKTQALVRAVAHEAELLALLDPNNDETVELLFAAAWDATRTERFAASWVETTDWHRDQWRKIKTDQIKGSLAALRAAANGEG